MVLFYLPLFFMSTSNNNMTRYIYTASAGRSGQETLSSIFSTYGIESYVTFEYPSIEYISTGKLKTVERAFRRRFVETHELLGRGNILAAAENNDYRYIEKIFRRRHALIEKKIKSLGANTYIDISKYFFRGLHLVANKFSPRYSLIHLVRDPVSNMRSFLNRKKNFFLDNPSPNSQNNILVMSVDLTPGELYLWSWFEIALRYEQEKYKEYVDRYVEIRTESLTNASYVMSCMDKLGIKYNKIEQLSINLNTNRQSGYRATKVTKDDIAIFESFVDKVPRRIVDKIGYLSGYDPYKIHCV